MYLLCACVSVYLNVCAHARIVHALHVGVHVCVGTRAHACAYLCVVCVRLCTCVCYAHVCMHVSCVHCVVRALCSVCVCLCTCVLCVHTFCVCVCALCVYVCM